MVINHAGRAIAACAGAVVAATALAPVASADFSGTNILRCTGDSISGIGASFINAAEQAWIADFRTNVTAASACPTFQITGQTLTYDPAGSGAGRRSFGSADGVYHATHRFAATDEPPSLVEQARMEAGSGGRFGALHTIPATSGAVAIVVNFPDGCTAPAANQIGSGTTSRFQVSNANLEKAFAGDASVDTWGELLPGIAGAGCAAKEIERTVRLDSSGTTFAVKDWLRTVNGARGWTTLGNTAWPNDVAPNQVNRGAAAGNGPLVDKMTATDGSIGYSDLATARVKGYDEAGANNDDRYWIPVYNGLGDLEEPSLTTDSITTGVKGANCQTTQYANVPSSTRSNWALVTGVGSPTGYAVCTLSYKLAWDDASDAYGNTAAEQAKARTVKDYVTYALSTRGQQVAAGTDYSPLASAVLSVATGGANVIGWNK